MRILIKTFAFVPFVNTKTAQFVALISKLCRRWELYEIEEARALCHAMLAFTEQCLWFSIPIQLYWIALSLLFFPPLHIPKQRSLSSANLDLNILPAFSQSLLFYFSIFRFILPLSFVSNLLLDSLLCLTRLPLNHFSFLSFLLFFQPSVHSTHGDTSKLLRQRIT